MTGLRIFIHFIEKFKVQNCTGYKNMRKCIKYPKYSDKYISMISDTRKTTFYQGFLFFKLYSKK